MEKIIISGLLAITLFILIIKIKTFFKTYNMEGCSCASCKHCSESDSCESKNEKQNILQQKS